jgi:hypothetical protein
VLGFFSLKGPPYLFSLCVKFHSLTRSPLSLFYVSSSIKYKKLIKNTLLIKHTFPKHNHKSFFIYQTMAIPKYLLILKLSKIIYSNNQILELIFTFKRDPVNDL